MSRARPTRLQQQLIDLWGHENETETVLMVTHGLDEAILLADRIVVMANAPFPSVRTIIDVPIPRPRHRTTIGHHPAFDEIQKQLVDLLIADDVEELVAA